MHIDRRLSEVFLESVLEPMYAGVPAAACVLIEVVE